ncbi:ABC transporter permease [Helicobacter fennelliae]|uniref:Macrolide export ATP-binding/permease protein MacB n=2 Tax=Helicobacter fennelliae TaxID=215 RepID=T1DUM5_9HELI|nr:ABC transporter permease [Helicobacter fennelliae]GAD17792.1 macrolide export ATP-binding/permease protein MacB [Helicobacter fennelliae MRY12-0050]SQB98186.1 ABC transporter [Helicobacter fennelliae]STP07686.1 ABC transporter [Helicobacter fennelliae]STQ84596.1 ABC transporter [Helicobacter fennelliae]
MILNAFLLALRQIKRNFLRAFLTMLGVIIGVGAVVVMISLGNGTTKAISDRVSSLGSNLLLVSPARSPNSYLRRNFSLQDAKQIKNLMREYIVALAPISQSSVVLQYKAQNVNTTAQGVDSDFFVVTQWNTSDGRIFEDNEYKVGSNVCVIGESVRKNLFLDENPLGKKIRLSTIVCECIGVLETKGQGGMGNDQDDVILLPMKAFSRSISRTSSLQSINRFMIRIQDNVDSAEVTQVLTKNLRKIRNVRENDKDSFDIMDTKEIAQTLTATTKMLTALLGFIAGVSLIVGGIGIMNIMLVSVTERTREIGTRMAIGALQSEVLLQFLIEAVTLSSLGGITGIVWAFFASWFLSDFMSIPFIFDIPTAIIAFLFSAFIGVLFGYLPAKRASKLNPIDALRHE